MNKSIFHFHQQEHSVITHYLQKNNRKGQKRTWQIAKKLFSFLFSAGVGDWKDGVKKYKQNVKD